MTKRNWSLWVAIGLSWAVAAGAESAAPTGVRTSRYGAIGGRVTNSRGVAQVGIPVTVTRRDGRFVQQVYTQSNGRFGLARLVPGIYAVEVILPSFLPFWKGPISVQPGGEILLEINLWTLAESVEFRLPENPGAAREEWKWVLRSGSPPRPILRFWEEVRRTSAGRVQDPRERALRGTVQVRAGNDSHGFGSDPGLRTSFDMEYAWTGASVLGLAGSAGWERGTPAASFRTAWSRHSADGASSALSATVRQLFLPGEYWRGISISERPSGGRVQSVTVGYENETALSQRLHFHYGTLFDTLMLGGPMNRWSPFARLTYSHAEHTKLAFVFTAAAPRVLPSDWDPDRQKMEQWLAIPQLSSGHSMRPVLEGGKHMEASWEYEWGSRFRFQTAAFYDVLSDMALSLSAVSPNGLPAGLLRDPFSNRYFLSGGDYSSPGARTSLRAKLSGNSEVIFGYSYAGGLRALADDLVAENSQALQDLIRTQGGHSFTVKVRSTVPRIKTQVTTSYRWIPRDTVVPIDPYDRGLSHSDPYLNLVLLQPLPSPNIFPGQFQALADFNNLLAQGYLAVHTPDGGKSYLFPAARSFRGGFNFIF